MTVSASNGKHWVLLRGLVRQHRHWEQFPGKLQQAIPGAVLHLLDLPGNGDLCDRPSPLRIGDMVESVRSQLHAKGIDEPVNVLAISLGGMVTIEWMHRYRQEIQSAVIINTSLRGLNTLFQRLRPQNYPAILRNMLFQKSPLQRERLVLSMSSNLYPQLDELALRWEEYGHHHPTSRRNALRQLLAASRYRVPARKPHERVLLLASEQDRLVNAECSRELAAHWGWPLVMHPTAGHDLPLDDGDWVIRQIVSWMQEQAD